MVLNEASFSTANRPTRHSKFGTQHSISSHSSLEIRHATLILAGLYIHIPFCKQRCIYCDFYFVTSQKHVDAFVETLKQELNFWGTFFGPSLVLDTIYFGGGTPSLLSLEKIDDILKTIHHTFDTSGVREQSFELNPDDVDAAYLAGLRAAGIDRLSIGIQSFSDTDLKWMNRAHNANDALQIVPMAREAGFDNMSVDLIFGLTGQTREGWQNNLELVVAMDIPHLSTYGLTIEPKTPLQKQIARGTIQQVSDAEMADHYQMAITELQTAGYEHYEVSSFCKPGRRSQHNQLYWQHTNYLGIGPSAHSFWRSENGPATRWANVSSIKQYIDWDGDKQPPASLQEEVEPEDLANEHIMLRLRTRDGLDLQVLKDIYKTDLDPDVIDQLLQEGIAEINGSILSLTNKGLLICNAVTEKLMRVAKLVDV